ncbi:MAG TPA: hypothetical protein VD865_17950 [Stenotrophomonas sp.]|nr:hypothetical protein [Stenotrophomonas sp.]
MNELTPEQTELVAGGSLYSEINDLYEAAKEFSSSFWSSAKQAYGIEEK